MSDVRKTKTPRDRLIGAFSGAGGGLILYPLLLHLLLGKSSLEVSIVSEIVGILLIALAITIYIHK